MEITIRGSIDSGPSWEQLSALIASMLGTGRMTQIARRDHGCHYRATRGVYDVTYCPNTGNEVAIVVRVND